jgi:ATP-dependent Lon protease
MKRMPRSTPAPAEAVPEAIDPFEIELDSEPTEPILPLDDEPEKPRKPRRARAAKAGAKSNPASTSAPRGADDRAGGVWRVVPAIPMRGLVAFPGMVMPLFIGREKSTMAAQAAYENDKVVLLVAQRDENTEEPGAADLHPIGTLATVSQLMKMPDGNLRVVIEGGERAFVDSVEAEEPFLLARVRPVEETEAVADEARTEAMARRLREGFEQVVNLSRNVPPEAMHSANGMEKVGEIADLVAGYLEIPLEARQQVLEELDHARRAALVVEMLGRELQVLEIERELDSQVREGVSDSQREYFLRERMKAIQDKLGERDANLKDADNLRERIEAAEMSEEAREKALSEIERMERMPPDRARGLDHPHLCRAAVRPAVGQEDRRPFGL